MAEARVDLVLGNSQFLQGIAQADAAQKRFASSWESNIGSIFKRSPFARAERAISDFAIQLGGGNLSGAFAALGSRVTGFGLGVGVALAAGVELFNKFRNEAHASALAVAAVNRELGTPAAVQGALGSGTSGVIDRQSKLLESLQNRSGSLGARIADALRGASQSIGSREESELRQMGFTLDQISKMRQGAATGPAAKAEESLQQRITELLAKRAEYEERIGNIKAKSLIGDKLAAQLESNQLSFEQSRAELLARSVTESQGPGRHNTLEDFTNFSRSLIGLQNFKNAQDVAPRAQQIAQQLNGELFERNALQQQQDIAKQMLDPQDAIDFAQTGNLGAIQHSLGKIGEQEFEQRQRRIDQINTDIGTEAGGNQDIIKAINDLSKKMDEIWK